ncbi:MAG: DUF3047 domain-containing protein [Acidobacteria bacterium]|nr:DUF3047 domain-containing protein [Acidobacteriota bacterium]
MTLRRTALGAVMLTAAVAPPPLLHDAKAVRRPQPINVGSFSTNSAGSRLPNGWQELTFRHVRRHTTYTLVADGGQTVLRAEAHDGASLLYTRTDLPSGTYRDVRWRWKVDRTPKGADLRYRHGDDAAARVYVAFRYRPVLVPLLQRWHYLLARNRYGEYPPYAGISYVWAHQTAPHTVLRNPLLSRSVEYVIESGEDRAGRWIEERRDVYRDFVRVFDFPPPPISHVAVMSDADDTGSQSVAWYGDIELLPAVLADDGS